MCRPPQVRLRNCILWLTLLFSGLLGTSHLAAEVAPAQPLSFGVYTHIRSTEMLHKMAPLQAYLQKALAGRGVRAAVSLRIFPSYTSAIDALAQGQVDFVRYGPVSYVLAKERNPNIRLLAMESNGGSKSFNGVISVPRDSPIQTAAELRGKRIAFGDRRSTTGRYLAQAALLAALDGRTYLRNGQGIRWQQEALAWRLGLSHRHDATVGPVRHGVQSVLHLQARRILLSIFDWPPDRRPAP